MTISEADALALLAAAPAPPADPALFSADGEAGPGIYPQGPPMVAATGSPIADGAARALVRRLLTVQVRDPVAAEARAAMYDDPRVVARVPDPGVRAGLLLLAGTPAEPVLDAFLAREGLPEPVETLRYGRTASPTRIVGPAAGGDRHHRVVSDRYAAEHPALLPGPLAHELLGNAPPVGNAEEAILHGLLAMVQMRVLVTEPAVARLGTELARRVNAFVISLFNARAPGSPWFALVAPDGPGTVPGGAPSMQTPDFWSIPFVGGPARDTPAPPAFRAVLQELCRPDAAIPERPSYDLGTATLLSTGLGDAWLAAAERVVIGRTLGLLPPAA